MARPISTPRRWGPRPAPRGPGPPAASRARPPPRIACPSILKVLAPQALRQGIDFTAVRGFTDMPYTVPNQRVDYAMRNGHVPVGFWRAPGQQNPFYRECFVDELAAAAGKDPLAFRLGMLKAGDRNRLVLEAVARAAGWGAPLPPGVHRGIAGAAGFGGFTAMVDGAGG